MKRMFVMVFALYFVIALAGAALAEGKDFSLNYDFKGQVTSIDFLAKSLTVKASDPFWGASTFTMGNITKVTMCGQLKTVEDLKPGEIVTVAYHENNGKLYADAIDLSAPIIACLVPGE